MNDALALRTLLDRAAARHGGWERWHRLDAITVQVQDLSGLVPLPDRLTVRYPPGSHTHGPLERFHFDPSGLLRRHDYQAQIIGPGTHGAHFSDDYVEVEGLQVARARRVVLRLGDWASPVPVLQARLEPRGGRVSEGR